MSQPELHVSNGGQKGTVIPLPIGKFMIGREEDCQLRPNSDLVSRHHCVFNVDEYGVRLRDLGSTNGTLVNGERIRAVHELKHGDTVSVGRLDFRVVLEEGAVVEEATPDDTVASAEDLDTMMEPPSVDNPTPAPASVEAGETMTDMPVVGDETQLAASAPPAPGETGFYYPGAMPGMPYPQPPYGYPGYPMPPMGGFYPGMGYPPQMYPQFPPQQPYPAQPGQQPQQPDSETPVPEDKTQEVRLPDPSETGAKAPEPKGEPPKDAKGQPQKNITDTAAGIIKQYLQRRPTS